MLQIMWLAWMFPASRAATNLLHQAKKKQKKKTVWTFKFQEMFSTRSLRCLLAVRISASRWQYISNSRDTAQQPEDLLLFIIYCY